MAIKVNGTNVITDARALNNITSVDATTAAAIGNAGVGGGMTLLATASTSGAREITVSSLSLSSYDFLYFFGDNVQGNDYYDFVHIRSTSTSTGFINRVASNYDNRTGMFMHFGGVIDLNTGTGFSSFSGFWNSGSDMVNVSAGGSVGGFDTGLSKSSTSLVIGHSEGNGGNFTGGTVKFYGI